MIDTPTLTTLAEAKAFTWFHTHGFPAAKAERLAKAEIRAAREGFTVMWIQDRNSLGQITHTATLFDAGHIIGRRVLDKKPSAPFKRVTEAELAAEAFDIYDYPETETETETETPTRTGNYETDHIDRVTSAEQNELDKHGPASDAPLYDETDVPLYRLQLSAFHADAKTHHLSVTHEQVQAIRAILAGGK